MLYKRAYTCEYECTHAFAHITCKVHPGAVQMLSNVTLILGIQDHSGLRLHLTPTLREYDIGLFEVAVNVDPNMILPPHFPALTFRGFGLPRCLQEVCSFVTFTHLSRFFKYKLYPEYNAVTRFSSHSRQHKTGLIFSQNTQFFLLLQKCNFSAQSYYNSVVSKCFANLAKRLYVIVRRLPTSLVDEYSGCFRHLCMMYLFVNAFYINRWKISFIKILKWVFIDSFSNLLTITNTFGNLAT